MKSITREIKVTLIAGEKQHAGFMRAWQLHEKCCGELADPELLSDKSTETLFDLRMAGNRSFFSVFRIHVDIMVTAVTFHVTSGIDQLSNERLSFHTSTSNSLVWILEWDGLSSSDIIR